MIRVLISYSCDFQWASPAFPSSLLTDDDASLKFMSLSLNAGEQVGAIVRTDQSSVLPDSSHDQSHTDHEAVTRADPNFIDGGLHPEHAIQVC